MIEKIVTKLKLDPKFVGSFIGHRLKFVEGHYKSADTFNYDKKPTDHFRLLRILHIERASC